MQQADDIIQMFKNDVRNKFEIFMLIISCIFLMLLRVLIETQQNIAIFPKILYIIYMKFKL